MEVKKQPVRFGGGNDPIVTGTKYQIPFGGFYTKYDDGGKVFRFFTPDRTIRYSAQLFQNVWHCKVEVVLENYPLPVEYVGRHPYRKQAWKQVRQEIDEHRKALAKLPVLKV